MCFSLLLILREQEERTIESQWLYPAYIKMCKSGVSFASSSIFPFSIPPSINLLVWIWMVSVVSFCTKPLARWKGTGG
jgi:hypothetical protein